MIYFNMNFLMLSIKMYLNNIGEITNYFLVKTHAKSLLAHAIFWREEVAIISVINSSFLGKHLHNLRREIWQNSTSASLCLGVTITA